MPPQESIAVAFCAARRALRWYRYLDLAHYRIDDGLKGLVFVRAAVSADRFYIVMAPAAHHLQPINAAHHRAYVHDAPSGPAPIATQRHDAFKLCAARETDDLFRALPAAAAARSSFAPPYHEYVSDVELDGRFYGVYRAPDMQPTVQHLEERIAQLEAQAASTTPASGGAGSGDDALRRQLAAMEESQARMMRQIEALQRGAGGPPAAAGAPSVMAEVVDGRLADVEAEVRQLAEMVVSGDVARRRSNETYFFEVIVGDDGKSSLSDTPVNDPGVLAQLEARLEYYKTYRIRDTTDGLVLRFRRSFAIRGMFFLEMHSLEDPKQVASRSGRQRGPLEDWVEYVGMGRVGR